MTGRTTETTVTFMHPFTLPSVDGLQPAGTYRLVTDEEEIPGLSFVAFRRVATMLHVPAIGVTGRLRQVFLVTPVEITTALASDGRAV